MTEITLYDLACTKNVCFSPVVWRIRLILNYKQIPYKTVFLEFPDIEPTLKALYRSLSLIFISSPNNIQRPSPSRRTPNQIHRPRHPPHPKQQTHHGISHHRTISRVNLSQPTTPIDIRLRPRDPDQIALCYRPSLPSLDSATRDTHPLPARTGVLPTNARGVPRTKTRGPARERRGELEGSGR